MKTTKIVSSVAAGLLAFTIAGCGGGDDVGQTTTPAAEEAVIETPIAGPTTEESTPYFAQYDVGDKAMVRAMNITVDSFEVVPSVTNERGEELEPTVDGRELLLVHSTFTNTGTESVDLTCSGPEWYLQGFDTNDNELATYFDLDYYPGNPECNGQLLNGETTEWTFAFEIPTSSKPAYLTFTDVWGDNDFFAILLDPDIELTASSN